MLKLDEIKKKGLEYTVLTDNVYFYNKDDSCFLIINNKIISSSMEAVRYFSDLNWFKYVDYKKSYNCLVDGKGEILLSAEWIFRRSKKRVKESKGKEFVIKDDGWDLEFTKEEFIDFIKKHKKTQNRLAKIKILTLENLKNNLKENKKGCQFSNYLEDCYLKKGEYCLFENGDYKYFNDKINSECLIRNNMIIIVGKGILSHLCGYYQYRVDNKFDRLFSKYNFIVFESERISVLNDDDVINEEDYYKYWNYKPQ